jgi:beta-lactamase regulating signal transducer with metallopeptidase domain
MEQFLAEYFVNSIWQVLLLVLGAWLLLRALRPNPQVQHWIWIGVLPLILVMPLLSMHSGLATRVQITPLPLSTSPDSDLTAAEFPIPTQVLEHASQVETSDMPALPVASQPDKAWFNAWTERIHRPQIRELQLGPAATLCVVGFYLITIALALVRLLVSWQTARRVIGQAVPALLSSSESLLLDQCCRRLEVNRPEVLQSAEVRSPMVVGVIRPALLLPEGLANRTIDSSGHPGRSLQAVLLHELAHLQRRDCLANLAYRVLSLPVAYHPAAWAVRQRIRQTQEMLCDAIAAAEMQSPIKYARCLVGLAQNMHSSDRRIAQVYGATMFDGRILEERVMQLIETRKTQSVGKQTIRMMCGAAVIAAAIVAAATFHVTPTLAQSNAAATPEPISAARSGQSNPSETAIQAESSESAEQIENATRQFEAAMNIVAHHLSRSADRDIHNAEISEQRALAQQAAANGQIASAQTMIDNGELQRHLAEMQAKFNRAEFKQKMEKLDSPEFKKKMADAQAKFNSPEFKKHMADIQAKFDSPEFKEKIKKMANAQEKFNSPEFKKHMADMQAKFDSPEFKEKMKKMADAQVKFNSPEFKEKMKNLNSAEFQKRMADIQVRVNTAEFQERIANATLRVNNPEFRRQLEDLNQKYRDQLQQLLRQFNDQPSPSPSQMPSPSPNAQPAPAPSHMP